MSAYVEVGPNSVKRSLIAVYADPSGSAAPRVTINFGSLLKDLSAVQLETVLARLEQSEVLGKSLDRVRAEGFNTYPAIPLTDFSDGDGAETLMSAITPYLSRPSL
jgi:hypothetical protein